MNKRNENKPGYKETKAGCIPEDWEVVRLEDIGSFEKGSGITKDDLLEEGLPAIRYGEIYTDHNYIIKKFYSFIGPEIALTSKKIASGDVLFAGSGETHEDIGKCVAYIGEEEAYAGGDIIILSLSKGNPEFLGYLLNQEAVNRQKSKYGQGVSIAHIYASFLKDIIVGLPTKLEEQAKIAGILSTWEKAIELVTKQIEAKQRLKKNVMGQLLTGKLRFSGFVDDWREVKLGELFSERNENNTLLDLLSITSDGGVIPRDDVGRKDTSSEDKSNYKVIKPGDIGYNTMRMWQGRSAVSRIHGIVSPAYTIVTPRDNQDVDFYGYLFKLPSIIHLFYRYSQGLVSDTWSLKYPLFAQIKAIIPGYEEQRRISGFLLTLDREIQILQQKMETIIRQKKGLMQKLLTGEVRVKV